MRKRAVISTLVVTALLGGAAPSAADVPPGAGFIVRPQAAVAGCVPSRGVRLPSKSADGTLWTSARIGNGTVLTAVSDYRGNVPAHLYSLTLHCRRNLAFGVKGIAKVGAPGTSIMAVQRRRGGGAILAGGDRRGWVVIELTERGVLDPRFGRGGVVRLPYRGVATTVTQAASGRLIVAGDTAGLHRVVALAANGERDRGYGTSGSTMLPPGPDLGVDSINVREDGSAVIAFGGGNMGCWYLSLLRLSAAGRPDGSFARAMNRFWRRMNFGTFEGTVLADRNGFTIVGTGQRPCFQLHGSDASSTGIIARFNADGSLRARPVRFRSPMYGTVDAFADGDDTIVYAVPYFDRSRAWIAALRPDGTVDRQFGEVHIHMPWWGFSARLATDSAAVLVSRHAILVVAGLRNHSGLRLIRVRV